MPKLPPLKPIDTPRCDKCKSALLNDAWYRERERHMVEAFEQGYHFNDIAAAYNRPPEWVRKTLVERYGKDQMLQVMRHRASTVAGERQLEEKLEEHEYERAAYEDAR